MKTTNQQTKYDIIFQKLTHLRLENADVTILCDELKNDLDSSVEIINEMKGLSEVNSADSAQYYSGS